MSIGSACIIFDMLRFCACCPFFFQFRMLAERVVQLLFNYLDIGWSLVPVAMNEASQSVEDRVAFLELHGMQLRYSAVWNRRSLRMREHPLNNDSLETQQMDRNGTKQIKEVFPCRFTRVHGDLWVSGWGSSFTPQQRRRPSCPIARPVELWMFDGNFYDILSILDVIFMCVLLFMFFPSFLQLSESKEQWRTWGLPWLWRRE